jgi:hypothetical protein
VDAACSLKSKYLNLRLDETHSQIMYTCLPVNGLNLVNVSLKTRNLLPGSNVTNIRK